MDISEMIEFIETDRLSFTFTENGLKYLSLRENEGEETLYLKELKENSKNPMADLLIRETIKFLETGNHDMVLDLDDLTDFQQTVFDVVNKINPGDIYTYKEIAEMLGKPGGARAVGGAVASNPVSYFIPTHRVLPQKGIGECGSGAGFLREKLLEHEGHDINKLRN